MRSKLLRLTVAFATFVAGVLAGSIYRSVQQQRLVAQANQAAEVPTSTPQSVPVDPPQVETYPDDLEIDPFHIEFFINQHPEADLTRLWERLGITTEGDPIANFSFYNACSRCEANSFQFNLDDDAGSEIVLQIKQQLGDSYRYLIFKSLGYGKSKFLGHVDIWAKYPPSDPIVLVTNNQAWMILQSTAATGTGLGAWLSTVYEVSDRGVRRVGSYLGDVSQSGDLNFPAKTFFGRPVSCEIRDGRAILKVSYTIEYFGGGVTVHSIPLFTKRKEAVLIGSLRSGSSSIDTAKSEITPHEFETIYNFDSMGPEEFLQYNQAELCAIATGNNSEKKKWLRDFLTTCDNSAAKRELMALLN